MGARAAAFSPDGRFAYVANDGMTSGINGGIVAMARDPGTGQLSTIDCAGQIPYNCGDRDLSLAGATDVVVAPDGRHVYVAAQGRLVTLARSADGTITRTGCIGAPAGCEREPDLVAECGYQPPGACRRDGGFSNGELALSPDARRLYLAAGTVLPRVFVRDPASGELDPQPPAPCGQLRVSLCSGLLQTEGLAVAANGHDIYSTLGWYRGNREPEPMILRSRQATGAAPLVPWGCLGGDIDPACTDAGVADVIRHIAMAPGDQALYASFEQRYDRQIQRRGSGVAVFARNEQTGAIAPANCVSSDGSDGRCLQAPGLEGARALLVSPDGRNVYVAGDSRIAVLGPTVASTSRTIRFSRAGRTKLPLSCPAVARSRCRGRVVLTASSGNRKVAARGFSIAPGRKARVAVKLGRRGSRVLRSGRRLNGLIGLRATGRISGLGVRQVTLRRVRR